MCPVDWPRVLDIINPYIVQSLSMSNFCPMTVQGLSKKRSCRESVRSISMSCQSYVNPTSSSNTLGQRLDRKIQSLSRQCPLRLKLMPFFMLDKLWTYFGFWKYGLRVHILGFWKKKIWDWTVIGQNFDMDRLWTMYGFMTYNSRSQSTAHRKLY